MRYQMVALRLALTEQMKRPFVWMMILLILLFAFFSRFFVSSEERMSAAASVGVVLPEEGAELFCESLERRSGQAVEFIRTDEETLRRNVSVSRWDCGLILDEDFNEKLREADLDEAVTLVISPGSTVYPLVKETVAAAMAELVSPVIAEQYLIRSGIADGMSLDGARQRLEAILADVQRVGVVMETLDGSALDALALAKESGRRMIVGSLAVVLVVWVLYIAVDLGRWRRSGAARRMAALRSAAALLLPRLLGALIPVFVAGALAIIAIFGGRGVMSALALAPYLAALGAAALLIAVCPGSCEAVPAVVPLAAVACFALCPVFVDLSLLLPGVGAVSRFIPVTLYLEACEGDGAAAVQLIGMAAILFAGAGAVGRLRERAGRELV